MRIFIILSTLALISCGKPKDVGSQKSALKNVEQNSFVTISYTEGNSAFRKRLMNAVVEESLAGRVTKPIESYEELTDYKMDERDLKNYKEKEVLLTKAVFSFPNRTEIYFLPENIPLGNIPQKLELSADKDRVFKMLKSDYLKTNRGSVVYFVSVNHDDLIQNDQNYFSVNYEMKDKFSEKTLMLDASKKYELQVGYKYFIQNLVPQSYKINSPERNRGCAEDGSCGPCTFKRMIAGGDFTPAEPTALSQLGLGVKINGKAMFLDYPQSLTTKGSFSVVLKHDEHSFNGGGLEIVQNEAQGVTANQDVYDQSSSCNQYSSVIAVTRPARAELSVTLKVWGRGEELRKIKL